MVVDAEDAVGEEEDEALAGALRYHRWVSVSQIFRIYPEKQLLYTLYVA